ncbi:phage tail sheath family protein [Mucilaginibacter agri]|uniref:Phage tail sheath family protein n=1 Tax=Mucilaginibacter agri TaxID=2695265 RepID=A0A966DWT6_9SPHI|nr:phage tail sheath C-terminal domain-containing protein [Mucilaginibacter agri]NCD71679.1 phage tail sheath family protein [Mucilaginibacter agri]
MPVQPSYPGVYIEEIPSDVHTITGAATSITAFIGRALRGDLNSAITITSFSDFQTLFGGVWADSMMSYAVKDFYLNGGSKAVIVRIAKNATKSNIKVLVDGGAPGAFFTLEAASEGSWGDNLKISINYKTKDPTDSSLFNLLVAEAVDGGSTEKFLNVSVNSNDPRYLPRVLNQSSMLVRVKGTMSTFRPKSTLVAVLTSPPSSPPDMVDNPISVSVKGSDGVDVGASEYQGEEKSKTGIYALENEDFNILCIPPPSRDADTDPDVYSDALALCVASRAMLLVDAPTTWGDVQAPVLAVNNAINGLGDLDLTGPATRNAALFFPRVLQSDPMRDGQIETFAPCGMIAGIMARTDTARGVWKSPAGIDATLNGIRGLQINLSDDQNGQLNPLGINCLRSFPVVGQVVWGTRTLRGADELADEYKYIAVRRTALFIEESLYRGTKWVVFEPNDEPLWAQIRLNIGAFMQNLFRQGAFQGKTPKEAYLVKCDSETTSQNDINSGIVNILVGFAPLKPAEFVILKIQQLAGQIDS